jgi:hypothetical protein
MANTNFSPQISKSGRIKRFGENVSQLHLCVYVSHLNVSFLSVISQEVVPPLKVSHSFVEDSIFGNRDATSVIAHERNSSKLTPKSLMVCTIHRIWEQQLAAATYLASVVDWTTEDYFQEYQQMREYPRK